MTIDTARRAWADAAVRRPVPRRRHPAGTRSRVLVVALTAGLLAACAPVSTDRPYEAADGVDVTLPSGVRGINLLVISDGDGEPGTVLGALSNDTAHHARVSLESGGETIRIPIEAGQTVLLSTDDGVPARIERVDPAPGALVPLTLSTDDGAVSVQVPLLDGTLPEYAPYLP